MRCFTVTTLHIVLLQMGQVRDFYVSGANTWHKDWLAEYTLKLQTLPACSPGLIWNTVLLSTDGAASPVSSFLSAAIKPCGLSKCHLMAGIWVSTEPVWESCSIMGPCSGSPPSLAFCFPSSARLVPILIWSKQHYMALGVGIALNTECNHRWETIGSETKHVFAAVWLC